MKDLEFFFRIILELLHGVVCKNVATKYYRVNFYTCIYKKQVFPVFYKPDFTLLVQFAKQRSMYSSRICIRFSRKSSPDVSLFQRCFNTGSESSNSQRTASFSKILISIGFHSYASGTVNLDFFSFTNEGPGK
jgi:hypothetical protein